MDNAERSSSPKGAGRDPAKPPRTAAKDVRRQQLIEATIDSLAKRGYAETTMADVADGAGLSRGIVNFHFESKEKLLIATLQYMSDEYAEHWRMHLEKAGDKPADQLRTLVAADFDRSICTKRKLGAWCAFWGEAKSRPTYQALCGARDETYQKLIVELVSKLKDEAGYDYDARSIALALEFFARRALAAPDDGHRKRHAADSTGSSLRLFGDRLSETLWPTTRIKLGTRQ